MMKEQTELVAKRELNNISSQSLKHQPSHRIFPQKQLNWATKASKPHRIRRSQMQIKGNFNVE